MALKLSPPAGQPPGGPLQDLWRGRPVLRGDQRSAAAPGWLRVPEAGRGAGPSDGLAGCLTPTCCQVKGKKEPTMIYEVCRFNMS